MPARCIAACHWRHTLPVTRECHVKRWHIVTTGSNGSKVKQDAAWTADLVDGSSEVVLFILHVSSIDARIHVSIIITKKIAILILIL